MMTSLYYEFKRQSFAEEEILAKERSLRSIMKLWSEEEVVNSVIASGFSATNLQCFWRNHNFAAFSRIEIWRRDQAAGLLNHRNKIAIVPVALFRRGFRVGCCQAWFVLNSIHELTFKIAQRPQRPKSDLDPIPVVDDEEVAIVEGYLYQDKAIILVIFLMGAIEHVDVEDIA